MAASTTNSSAQPIDLIAYADDSGDDEFSYYSAVLLPLDRWDSALNQWLKYRQWLYRTYAVPARFELHAYDWLMAKDDPPPVADAPNAAVNVSKALRRELAVKALKAIGTMAGVKIVSCRIEGTSKADAYRALVGELERVLSEMDGYSVVVSDGDPKNPDPHLLRVHRDLDIRTRRVVEDPWIQAAHASQLVQVADLIAHCAFQAHKQAPAREFMWDWYQTYVHPIELECACP